VQEQGYIQLDNGTLQYLKIGSGNKLLLAFHGYGNDASIFTPFEAYLPGYTIISINLPYHGDSNWQSKMSLQRKDLVAIAQHAMNKLKVDKLSLLGFSMGARCCMCLVEEMPQCIDTLILAAPDGLVPNPLYNFVTNNFLGKWVFGNFLTHPGHYMPFIRLLKRLSIISKGRYKFAMYYLEKENDRDLLLKVWPNMSDIIPDRKKLKAIIAQRKIPVYIFIGRYDKVIPVDYGEKFKKNIPSVQLHVLDKGHWLFDEETIFKMIEYLR